MNFFKIDNFTFFCFSNIGALWFRTSMAVLGILLLFYRFETRLAMKVVSFPLLGVLIWTDLKHRIIPNWIIGIGSIIAGIMLLKGDLGWEESLVSAFGVLLILFTVCLSSKGFFDSPGLGMGDLKLFFVLGLFIGWDVFWVLYLSIMLAGLFAFAGMVMGVVNRKDRLPFVPFIVSALLINVYWISWNQFIDWWL